MPTTRWLLSSAALILSGATTLAAQSRIIDEGTFLVTRPGVPTQTESFRIRVDNGTILATGQVNAGAHRVTSALTTDTLGTPIDYRLDVRDNGAQTMSISAVARSGRLTARSQLPRGDESTREYPIVSGTSLILDDELVHQTYFLALGKRTGSVQIIRPHASRAGALTLTALGLEPVTIAGKQITATHYSLANGPAVREFWVDATGRLLQVEIPSAGIKAVREELPR
jgi:hypothetical protein